MFKSKYYLSVLTATIGASTQFYSYNVVNPAQEVLTKWINSTYYARNGSVMTTSQVNFFWSFVVSCIAIGALCGALLTRLLAERLGRRNALIANGVFNILGAASEFFSYTFSSPEMLIAGRFVLGVNLGLSSGLVPMYLMEISPTRYRGAAGTAHQAAVAFADWFSIFMALPEIFGDSDHWPIAFGFPGFPALLLCSILPFCPESPKFTLLRKADRKKTLEDLEQLVDPKEAAHMFESLIKEAAYFRNGVANRWELFSRKDLRFLLFMAFWMMIAQQFTGCAAVFAYSTDMFISAKLTPQMARYSTLALGVSYFIAACAAVFLIEKLGRRFLSIFQLSSVTVALSLISLLAWFQTVNQSNWLNYATILLFVFYMVAYGIGSPIPWLISSEMFPTKFRSAAVTFTVFVSFTNSFFVSLAYLAFKEAVGVSLSYLPFIIVSGLSAVLVYYLLPETKNRQSEDIAREMGLRFESITFSRQCSAIGSTCSRDENHLLRLSETDSNKYLSLSNVFDQ